MLLLERLGLGTGAPWTDFFLDKAWEINLEAVFGYSFLGFSLFMLLPNLDYLTLEEAFLYILLTVLTLALTWLLSLA